MHSICPFPHRRTAGRPGLAAHFDGLAEREAARLRRIEHADPSHDREETAALLRAFETLAALHRQGWVPAPLFGVRTRRHVLTILQSEALEGDDLRPVRTALRFTLGLPMPRAHGFRLMREAFDTLGLTIPLPDRAEHPLPIGGDGCDVPQAEPLTFEAWTTAVDDACRDDDGNGLCRHFRTIDFHEAFECGMSPAEVVHTVTDWIVGCEVYGPRPFTWKLPCDEDGCPSVTVAPVVTPDETQHAVF
ncbi:MAG: hypothetical protein ABJF88_05725 [Rhodothermales bacterium]